MNMDGLAEFMPKHEHICVFCGADVKWKSKDCRTEQCIEDRKLTADNMVFTRQKTPPRKLKYKK